MCGIDGHIICANLFGISATSNRMEFHYRVIRWRFERHVCLRLSIFSHSLQRVYVCVCVWDYTSRDTVGAINVIPRI